MQYIEFTIFIDKRKIVVYIHFSDRNLSFKHITLMFCHNLVTTHLKNDLTG
jgi:hypothetical protein